MRESKSKSDSKKVRTRMAPSPTGEYHIGHIRTLLFNWAYARKHDGQFILRIEDTDRERYVDNSEERIMDVIKDYGFDWDEGPRVGGPHEPYIQSQRLEIYQEYIKKLLDSGDAYYCFCSEERLKKMREEQVKNGVPSPRYDRKCLGLDVEEVEDRLERGEEHVVRMKVPDDKKVKFKDLVLGEIERAPEDIDDQVLIKSDGFPTYHLGVVVDDHLMQVTHVMRGNDWVSSTPKHILLYEFFGWESPKYAHVPNIKEIGKGKKLSKRYGAVSAREFLDQGYLPEALLNFLMLLGWSPKGNEEIINLDEFIEKFSIGRIQKTDLVAFDRDKLDWMNGQYIKELSDEEFAEKVVDFAPEGAKKEDLVKTAPLVKTRLKKLSEFAELAGPLFEAPDMPSKDLMKKIDKKHLKVAKGVLEAVGDWKLDKINEVLLSAVEESDFKTGKFFMSLRVAIFSNSVTPPVNESIEFLGKEEVLSRLKRILD